MIAVSARNTSPPAMSASGGIGPFITWVVTDQDGGQKSLSTSRRHRKGLQPLTVTGEAADPSLAAQAVANEWRHFWAPGRSGWWVALFFMIGAALFALASAAALWPRAEGLAALGPGGQAWAYALGALFFTSAAFLQWLEAHNNDIAGLAEGPPAAGRHSPRNRWRLFGWCPRNLGYLAALIQLTGTLLFNLNTVDALIAGLGWQAQELLIWTPDVLGSVCFLVASQLAMMEVSHALWSWQPRNIAWWIAVINLLGSVFFMISALAAFVLPSAAMAAPLTANLGTFAGALCFLVGAYLLIPELFEKPI